MKKERPIDELLALFENYSIKRARALEAGNSKSANYCYNKIRNIVCDLKLHGKLSCLSIFYNHNNARVRLTAAANLLPLYEKKSLEVMNEISKQRGITAFEAEMTIQEWKNGHLKDFYTL